MKLKKILSEAKVWERNFGEPLPVLELKFGSKAQYDAYKKQHDIKDGTKIEIDGKKMTHRSSLPKGSKAVNKKIDVFTADLNKKLDAAEKALKDKKKNESLDEQGVLSRRAGINVFGDRKLQLMAKGLRQSAFDLEKVAKKKDEQAFDDILQRITITIGVMRSFLNKPKRSM
mgnify:FL=1|tara:strand:+ start:1063 stop:1578 length:516 start_codon:yes stop_codon:yes gene_type:complete